MYRYRESLPVDQRDAWAAEKRRMAQDFEEKPAIRKRQAAYRRLSKKAEIAKSTFADLIGFAPNQIHLKQSDHEDGSCIYVQYYDVRAQNIVDLCTVDNDNDVIINFSSIESLLRRFLPKTSVQSLGNNYRMIFRIKGRREDIGPLVGRLKKAGVECTSYKPYEYGGHTAAFSLSSLEDFVTFNQEIGGLEGFHELAG